MITVKENTTLVGITELRHKIDEILEVTKKNNVIIEKRNKPIAVLFPIDEYIKIQEILDMVEDKMFGHIAKERYEKSSSKNYISLESAKKKVGIK
ncbi:MAG: type II toxin-antitoxin system prevent-host-death family antitoxin [Candidatus Firestonebacteria bacterium]